MQEFTSHHKACLAYSLGLPRLSYRSNRQLFDFKRTKLLCHKIFVCKADICAAIRLKCLLQLYVMQIQFYLRFTTIDVHYSVHYQSVTEEIKSEKNLHLSCPPMKLFTQYETDTYTNYITCSSPTASILKTYWAVDVCHGYTFTIPIIQSNISAKQINQADL